MALELFCSGSPDRVTMADVAQGAQVSKRTLYTRFDSKDALLLAAVEHGIETLVAPISISIPATSMNEQLQFISLKMVETSLRPEVLALERMLAALAAQIPSVFARLSALLEQARLALFDEIFENAMRRGEISDRTRKIVTPIAFDILVSQLRRATQQQPTRLKSKKARAAWLDERIALIMNGALTKTP